MGDQCRTAWYGVVQENLCIYAVAIAGMLHRCISGIFQPIGEFHFEPDSVLHRRVTLCKHRNASAATGKTIDDVEIGPHSWRASWRPTNGGVSNTRGAGGAAPVGFHQQVASQTFQQRLAGVFDLSSGIETNTVGVDRTRKAKVANRKEAGCER